LLSVQLPIVVTDLKSFACVLLQMMLLDFSPRFQTNKALQDGIAVFVSGRRAPVDQIDVVHRQSAPADQIDVVHGQSAPADQIDLVPGQPAPADPIDESLRLSLQRYQQFFPVIELLLNGANACDVLTRYDTWICGYLVCLDGCVFFAG
jgi:hypothetical protein